MENQFYRSAGLALIIGSFLIIVTMVFHPVGGDINHLIKISTAIIVTHGIAIASVPISLFGYWGLTKSLGSTNIFSLTAFITIALGLFAAALAATLNGLALPFFVGQFQEADADTINSIDLILHYGFALNQGTTLIYIVGNCVAVLLWSIAIVRATVFPKWVGIVGILIGSLAVILLFSGFVFSDLHGLRIFVFGSVTWVLIIAIMLIRGDFNNTKAL